MVELMENFLFDSAYLNWVIIGVVFFIIEVSTFTLLFLWFAIASMVMAAILFVFPNMALSSQLLAFAILATLAVVAWHFFFKDKQKTMGDNKMNNRAMRYVGQTVTLVEPVENGFSKVKIDDSLWRVRCDVALTVGDSVKIVDADGVVLIAESV